MSNQGKTSVGGCIYSLIKWVAIIAVDLILVNWLVGIAQNGFTDATGFVLALTVFGLVQYTEGALMN